MCGISGIISRKFDIEKCKQAVDISGRLIRHRGPDQSGIFSEVFNPYTVCLVTNRLSIIDISPLGNQPMHLDDLVISYNGEIYNHQQIRGELSSLGHVFIGNSDTEVIIHAFREWGRDAVRKFIGMFAIALFNKKARKLLLFRDRVGEKPLYYYCSNDTIFFCSELKGILVHDFLERNLDLRSVYNFFIFATVAAPHTLFRGIKQLLPGEVIEISLLDDRLTLKGSRFWNFPNLNPDLGLTEKRVLSELKPLIYDAVKIRLKSDVPLGIFLSGGIDSSLIASVASEISPQIRTFCIGYADKRYDESRYAEFVANSLPVKHTTFLIEENEANVDFEQLVYVSDDCTSNVSFIPYGALTKKARAEVKVSLSGDGGDEFFCGYTSYDLIAKFYKYRKLLKIGTYPFLFNKKARILNNLVNTNLIDVLLQQFWVRDDIKQIKELFITGQDDLKIHEESLVENMLGLNKSFRALNHYAGRNYLADTVLKTTDRSSMFNSLEVRPVFTDHRIIEFMARVPDNIVLKNGIKKYLLKRLLADYIPKDFVFKRKKWGFSVPLSTDYAKKWLKARKDSVRIMHLICPDFLDLKRIVRVLESHSAYTPDFQARFVFFSYFLKRWI